MGLFSWMADQRASASIDQNGLSRGTHTENCERCSYCARDANSSYLVCTRRSMHVGANQVCSSYTRN